MRKYLALVLVCLLCMSGTIARAMPADGLYSIGVSSNAKMFRVVDCVLRVEDGKMTAVLTMSGSGYGYLYQGTAEDADAAPMESWTPYFEDGSGRHCFAIEIPALDAQIPMAAWSIRYEKWYDRSLQFFSNTLREHQEIAPEGVYRVQIVSDTPLNGAEGILRSKGGEMQLEAEGLSMQITSLDVRVPIEGGWIKLESQKLEPTTVCVADGTYHVNVETDSALLKFIDCCLSVQNGQMTALLKVQDKRFDFVYLGSAADANGDEAAWIEAQEDAEGGYIYEIPVESLDNVIALATHSGKKNLWYDREIRLDSSTLVAE